MSEEDRKTIFHCNIPRNDGILKDVVETFKNLSGVEIKSVITSTSDKNLNYMDITVTLPDDSIYAAYVRTNKPRISGVVT